MNRRRLLTTSMGLMFTPMLGAPKSTVASTATPVASPIASPIITSYADVGPSYDAASARLLAQGRDLTDLLLQGEIEALYARLAPAVQSVITVEELAGLIPSFEAERVHFEVTQFGVIFDGVLNGPAIDGIFVQGSSVTFSLTASQAPSPDAKLDGTWSGQIGQGDGATAIDVTFATSAGSITGTIDIPDQGLLGLPLENVEIYANRLVGDRRIDVALPAGGANNAYFARLHWRDAKIALQLAVGPDDQVTAFSVAPEWPLTEDPAAGLTSAVSYRLPFDGVWWVFWGGDTVMQNYHAATPAQRHAFDFLIWHNGATFTGSGTRNRDYWVHGQPLHAPANGAVVGLLNEFDENVPGEVLPDVHPAGNHLAIQTAESEFLYLAHLQPNSFGVRQGDRVSTGDLLALTGSSGNSSEPHLHIHLQNKADFFAPEAIGLPLRFSRYLANGEAVQKGTPLQGQFIARD